MIDSAMPEPDDDFACTLLRDFLTEQGASGFVCEIAASDPPDLIVTWASGERWGVEVTKTYQQIRRPGTGMGESWRSIGAHLSKLGARIGEATKEIRRCSYTLTLEAPGLGSSWGRSERRAARTPVHDAADQVQRANQRSRAKAWRAWGNAVETAVRAHIASGSDDRLGFPGGNLLPGEPGERWTVFVAAPADEQLSARSAMLRRALVSKTADLHRWPEVFAQRLLLLLNCHPLVDDPDAVEGTLRQIVREHPGVAGFDGILWSGYVDPKLVRMQIR